MAKYCRAILIFVLVFPVFFVSADNEKKQKSVSSNQMVIFWRQVEGGAVDGRMFKEFLYYSMSRRVDIKKLVKKTLGNVPFINHSLEEWVEEWASGLQCDDQVKCGNMLIFHCLVKSGVINKEEFDIFLTRCQVRAAFSRVGQFDIGISAKKMVVFWELIEQADMRAGHLGAFLYQSMDRFGLICDFTEFIEYFISKDHRKIYEFFKHLIQRQLNMKKVGPSLMVLFYLLRHFDAFDEKELVCFIKKLIDCKLIESQKEIERLRLKSRIKFLQFFFKKRVESQIREIEEKQKKYCEWLEFFEKE